MPRTRGDGITPPPRSVKQSGFGREEFLEDTLRFTQEKNIHVKLRQTGA
jgi:hypothetical protein